ncbi:MAG: hypothetical protein ACI35O_13020 [Bacillaceae bacterium]
MAKVDAVLEKELEIAKQEGIHEGKREVAIELLDILLPEAVVNQTGLSLEEVLELKKQK